MELFHVLKHLQCGGPRGDTEFSPEPPWKRIKPPCCNACGRYVGSMIWLPPYRVSLECWDYEYGDFALSSGENILVSERFKLIWERERLSGLEGFDPVEVVKVRRHKRKLSKEPPRYYRAHVVRASAAIDAARSGMVYKDPDDLCPDCRGGGDLLRWKRVVIEEGSWSGEDIFIPRGLADFVTTERFRQLCLRENVTNAVFVPAMEYWGDLEPWHNIEKAHEIMAAPPSDNILEKVQPDGEIWRYEVSGNYLVVATRNRTIRQIWRPFDGIDSWKSGWPLPKRPGSA